VTVFHHLLRTIQRLQEPEMGAGKLRRTLTVNLVD
jgi:hypothetical protein